MGVDHAGHQHGAGSADYRRAVLNQDELFSVAIPKWLERGYRVFVTADHGVGSDRCHGGTGDDLRLVPLYIIEPDGQGHGDTGELVDHTQIAPTIARSLGLELPPTMRAPAIAIRSSGTDRPNGLRAGGATPSR